MAHSKDQDKVERETGAEGAGQSGGGAYANPHSGRDAESNGFLGQRGQSEMEYHGTGRLGEKKTGDNANSPTRKSGPAKD